MPSRFHEDAQRSRLLDRKAPRRRRGLDGRGAVVTRFLTGRRGSSCVLPPPLSRIGSLQQLQCVGCDRKFYWPFAGTLLALCGPDWYRVAYFGLVGIWVGSVGTALHRYADCGKTTAIGRAMHPTWPTDVGTAPVTAGKAP